MTIASVLLDVAIGKPLDYSIPPELVGKVCKGSLVKVPLHNRTKHGAVIEIKEKSSYASIKPIVDLVNDAAPLTQDLLSLSFWLAEHYCTSWETVLKTMVPSSIRGKSRPKEQLFISRAKNLEELRTHCSLMRQKSPQQAALLDTMLHVNKGILLADLIAGGGSRAACQALIKKGLLKAEKTCIDRSPLHEAEFFRTKAKILNAEQAEALQSITGSMAAKKFAAHLLWGITGSGKTEVYLQAIDHALKNDQGAILLVPEISLTSQTIERFKSRFTDNIAILHCRLSQGERFDEWMKIARGEARIVIGARSSVFSPVKNLGLIIVDEEHDFSYKQSDMMPCYNARDVAVMRASFSQSVVILGSATPSLETFHNSQIGKYCLNTLQRRTLKAELPEVEIVDMRREWEKAKGFTLFSDTLLSGIKTNLQKGEQTILFLNRRGYHTSLFCPSCGEAVKCAECDVAMTYHYKEDHLSCHLCGCFQSPLPQVCPKCHGSAPMKFKGVGTEQVERALHAIFPEVRTTRLDRDTTKNKGSHQKIFKEFKTGKADVLIGTQMVAKGLHFPEVTLVGVLNCDSSLSIPDFRSSETTFQLITQVAGRSGRGALTGKVILQTLIPDNNTISYASQQDYKAFYEEEMATRKLFGYPPYSHLIKIRHSGLKEKQARQELEMFRLKLLELFPSQYEMTPVMASGHAKIKNIYRFQFLIRGPKIGLMTKILNDLNQKKKSPKFFIDVSPASTFF
ncbi:Primosomal protein N' [Chlamydiales bacterium STE3]|nr:Primosomal protein N' [Chlamydiales bacterium STE3]